MVTAAGLTSAYAGVANGAGRGVRSAEAAPGHPLTVFSVAAAGLALAVPFVAVAHGLAANTTYTGQDDHPLAARLVLGMVACLPWYLILVRGAVRERRHRLSGVAVAALTAVALCGLPLLGPAWIYSMLLVSTAVLLGLPAPWSWAVFAGIVVIVTPGLAVGLGVSPLWPALVASKGLAIDIVFRLVGSARQLRRARAELVAAAVAQERLRVEAEVGSAVSGDLSEITHRSRALRDRDRAIDGDGDAGQWADPAAVTAGIRGVTDLSRSALARARGVVHGYRDTSVRAELDLAAALLRAGGLTVDVRDGGLTPASGGELSPSARAELYARLAGALVDRSTGRVTLVADLGAGSPTIHLLPGSGGDG